MITKYSRLFGDRLLNNNDVVHFKNVTSNNRMDSIFGLDNGDRVSYLLNLMNSFGCSYICLWTYSPDINFLYCEDAIIANTLEASSSSGTSSLARKLFEDYKQTVLTVGTQSVVPGLAFRNRNPYVELQEIDLQRLASTDVQRHFYLEARIKMAVFLGCDRGEIELGMSYLPQNFEMRMQQIFPQDFARLPQPSSQQAIEVAPRVVMEQSRPSSSSPSPQSIDSPEYPQLLYTLPIQPTTIEQQPQPIAVLGLLENIPFPTPESTDAALTRAYLAILSSPSPSTTSSPQPPQQGGALPYESQANQRRPSAFKGYHNQQQHHPSFLGVVSNLRRQTLLKRAIVYYRGLNYRRVQDHASVHASRPTSNQLHHMISERRRREKINESFQALRSLLPSLVKIVTFCMNFMLQKDKASVLRTTKEYLSSLKGQILDLSKRNQVLEAQLKMKKQTKTNQVDVSTNERVIVQIIPVQESTSRERLVDLDVRLLRGGTSVADLIMRLLELLKETREVSFVSMEAQTHREETDGSDHHTTMDMVTFRLRIEGSEWDGPAFTEAVQRILADLGQPHFPNL